MTGSGELYLSILRRIIGPTEDKTLLDLCCGEMTQTRHLKFKDVLGVDVKDWPDRPSEIRFAKLNVMEISGSITGRLLQQIEKFDVCLCSDGIEHLTKRDGLELLQRMQQWSYLPIIFTPLDAYKVQPYSDDPDAHKCVWSPAEFEAMGWDTESYPEWHRELSIGAFFAWKPL